MAGELAGYADDLDADPLRLAAVEERRAALTALTRKYGEDIAAVLAWAQESAARLTELDGDDDRIGELTAERDGAARRTVRPGTGVDRRPHRGRGRGSRRPSPRSSPRWPCRTRGCRSRSGRPRIAEGVEVGGRTVAYGPTGADEVELLLAPHPGAPPRPIAKGASGGELSRVMLAVEVVFAGTDPVPTYLFDEVDAGVGGKAAVEIGRRLAKLAKSAQVVVVTHLPQVAAFADRQLLVEKTNDGSVTRSGVTVLEGEDRVRELSRMLAGPGGLGDGQGARGGTAGHRPRGRLPGPRGSPRTPSAGPRPGTPAGCGLPCGPHGPRQGRWEFRAPLAARQGRPARSGARALTHPTPHGLQHGVTAPCTPAGMCRGGDRVHPCEWSGVRS